MGNPVNQTRDYVIIRGLAVRHTTACRDWVCGECGSGLITQYLPPTTGTYNGWATVCKNDWHHSPDGFIHKTTAAWRESKRIEGAMIAQDVFNHLPAEMQATIEGGTNDK